MKWRLKTGKEVNFNPRPYIVDWDRKVSGPQKKVKDFLYLFWKNHIVLEEMTLPRTRRRYDILSLTIKCVIEISPDEVHLQYNEFMHGNRAGYLKKLKADSKKVSTSK